VGITQITYCGRVRLAVALPQDLSGSGPATLTAYARRAEQLGCDGLWALDSGIGGPTARVPYLDPLPALAAVAAVTERIPLGVAVIVASRRNPVQLAKDAASLAVLSEDRFVLGLGVGNDPPEAARLGFRVDHRGARLTDAVELMRALWTPGPTTYDSAHHHLDDVPMSPKPPAGTVPIWLAGSVPPALARAARLGDGWIGAGSAPLAAFPDQCRGVLDALEARGRDPESFPRSRRVYLAVEDTREEAVRRLAPLLDGMYGWPGMTERCGLCGPPELVAEELAKFADAGATELLLNPLHDLPGQLERLVEVRDLMR
jgi:probable F420-dependent oxidoreductase